MLSTKEERLKFVLKQKNKRRVCEIIGVSRSSIYYTRKTPKEDPYQELVLEIFDKHNGNYGSPRIKIELTKQGIIISKRRIVRILKANGRESKHGRRKLAKNIHTSTEIRYIAENLIKKYSVKESNEVCQMDVTQFRCLDGKLYACGIIDVYDKIVAASFGLGETKELISAAINERRKIGTPIIIHSDRGPANASKAVKELLEKAAILQSMSAPHRPNENQYIETFWKTLKTEVGNTKNWTRQELVMILEYYIDYYNTERIHSAIGYLTPQEKYFSWLAKRNIEAV